MAHAASVTGVFALDGTTAIVEMAAASGLGLVPPGERAPLRASTFGTGQLVRAALDAGATRILIGLGGSATNDAGAGLLQALGIRLLDAGGAEVGPGGAELARVATIDMAGLDPRLRDVRLDVACDVDNPLYGPNGAGAIFGPQKGASPDDVRTLDAAHRAFAGVAAHALGRDRSLEPGSGAAGGLGFALAAFLGATLLPGVQVVAELRGLPLLLEGAELCLTGEGSLDAQTLGGKTVDGVTRFALAAGVPAIVAFAGRLDAAAERELGERGVVALPLADGPLTLEAAMRDAAVLLERASARVARLLAVQPRLRTPLSRKNGSSK